MAAVVGAAAAVWCCTAPGAAGAAAITVNWTADELNGTDGHCSLREAVTAANTDTASGPTAGECAAGSGVDTIHVPPGTYKLTIPGPSDNANLTGDIDINSNLTIIGGGSASATVDAGGRDRVFDIGTARRVTLQGVKVTGGATPGGTDGASVTGQPGSVGQGQDGSPGEAGGGIRSAGTLTVTSCVIILNATGNGGNGGSGTGGDGGYGQQGGQGYGGYGGDGGDGGGIASTGPSLTLKYTTVTTNTTGSGGLGGVGTGGAGGSGNDFAGGGGQGGSGGGGGRGGGVFSSGSLIVDGSNLVSNTTGNGGSGSQGFGNHGTTVLNGGAGGQGLGGSGGAAGAGGGAFGAGHATVTNSSLSGNTTGSGGQAAIGVGGVGTNATSNGSGGAGGSASGGDGGAGGNGGGIDAEAGLTASGDTFASNTVGAGGDGANGTGGNGGNGGPTASGLGGNGGDGGWGGAGAGGAGGQGAGVSLGAVGTSSMTNDTLTANQAGAGAPAGEGAGGSGGNGGGTGNGGNGGAGYSRDGGLGGSGAISVDAQLTIVHATVNANSGAGGGAAGTGVGGGAGVAFGTGSDGSGGSSSLGKAGAAGGGIRTSSNVVAENSILSANGTPGCTGSGAVSDGGRNITFGDSTCPGTQVDPQLAALANNGGPTKTEALNATSPAIDAVPATEADCPPKDQRGVTRPHGAACEIGAYERAGPDVAAGTATAITLTSAHLQAKLVPNSATARYYFEFGTTAAYGTSTPVKTAGGTSQVVVSASVSGLLPHTTYHFRLHAANADGSSVGADAKFKTGTPSVSAVSPRAGSTAGGNVVTITGTNFVSGATVKFSSVGTALPTMFVSPAKLTVTAPAHWAGTVHVFVTTADGTSTATNNDLYAFGPPSVSAVSPRAGSTAGGNTVTITGTSFVPGMTVKFSSVGSALPVTYVSGTQVTVVAPAHAAGTVNVFATTPAGTSPAVSGDQYTFT